MDEDKLLDILDAYFENNGWPWDMNSEKLYDRSSLSEEHHKEGWGIIEIERHRSILGASYRKGQPMAAFHTYWMRYAINPETGEVEALPDKDGEICIDDIDSLVDEVLEESYDISIELIKSGKYLISDMVSKSEAVISTFDEAKTFSLEVATKIGDSFQMLINDEGLSIPDEQLKQLADEYKACVKLRILANVKKLWQERET
jgi:hypothetical protein